MAETSNRATTGKGADKDADKSSAPNTPAANNNPGGVVENTDKPDVAKQEADPKADDPTSASPVVEYDRLGPLATLSHNNLPPNGTGLHCGICGTTVGKEGQHYDADGDQVEVPHANVMVVADNWPAKQDEADVEAAANAKSRKSAIAGASGKPASGTPENVQR